MNARFEQHPTEDMTVSEQDKIDHLRDEATIGQFHFEARQCFAALLRIKQRRSYRMLNFTTFESYVERKWADMFGDISRMQLWRLMKHEETIQAVEQENVTRALHIEPPTSLRQSEALASLPLQDRPQALELAREEYGANPTGPQVAAVVHDLKAQTDERIARLDTDRKAKSAVPPPALPRGKFRKGFPLSAFEFNAEDQVIHCKVFKPANVYKGWPAKQEAAYIDLIDLKWELQNMGFALVPVAEKAAYDADEEDCPPPKVPSPQASLDELEVPRDLAGKPMNPKLIAYYQKRGYWPDYVPPTPEQIAANAAAAEKAAQDQDDLPTSRSFLDPANNIAGEAMAKLFSD